MVNLKYISSYNLFGGIKWIVTKDFSAKKKQLSFSEGLRPIAASIKEGLIVLRSTTVVLNFLYFKVNIEDVEELLGNYKSNPADWRKYAKFDKYKYTRNLVHEGNGKFNLMLLCWAPGKNL